MGFSPPPAVYRPRETAFSPLRPLLFAIHPRSASPSPSHPRSFSRGSFPWPPKRNECTTALPPATLADGPESERSKILRDGTSRVFRTRTWLAHVTSARARADPAATTKYFFITVVCVRATRATRHRVPFNATRRYKPRRQKEDNLRRAFAACPRRNSFSPRKTERPESVVVVSVNKTSPLLSSVTFFLSSCRLFIILLIRRTRRTMGSFQVGRKQFYAFT